MSWPTRRWMRCKASVVAVVTDAVGLEGTTLRPGTACCAALDYPAGWSGAYSGCPHGGFAMFTSDPSDVSGGLVARSFAVYAAHGQDFEWSP